jgi:hypothetical protein
VIEIDARVRMHPPYGLSKMLGKSHCEERSDEAICNSKRKTKARLLRSVHNDMKKNFLDNLRKGGSFFEPKVITSGLEPSESIPGEALRPFKGIYLRS